MHVLWFSVKQFVVDDLHSLFLFLFLLTRFSLQQQFFNADGQLELQFGDLPLSPCFTCSVFLIAAFFKRQVKLLLTLFSH